MARRVRKAQGESDYHHETMPSRCVSYRETQEATAVESQPSQSPDTRHIDVLAPGEIPYWTKALDTSVVRLLDAVDHVGTSAEQVRRYLRASP